MKKTILALMLLSTIYGAHAQKSNLDAEGRPTAASGQTRADAAACREQARERQMTEKERKDFMRSCVRAGAADRTTSSGASGAAPTTQDAEGRPSLSSGPTRSQTQACRADAAEKKLSGAERRSFMRECTSRSESASSGSSAASGTVKAQSDAEGRMPYTGASRAESRACAQEANEKKLRGAERREFMRGCVH